MLTGTENALAAGGFHWFRCGNADPFWFTGGGRGIRWLDLGSVSHCPSDSPP